MPHSAEGIVDCLYIALMDAARANLCGASVHLSVSEAKCFLAAMDKVKKELCMPLMKEVQTDRDRGD